MIIMDNKTSEFVFIIGVWWLKNWSLTLYVMEYFVEYYKWKVQLKTAVTPLKVK